MDNNVADANIYFDHKIADDSSTLFLTQLGVVLKKNTIPIREVIPILKKSGFGIESNENGDLITNGWTFPDYKEEHDTKEPIERISVIHTINKFL